MPREPLAEGSEPEPGILSDTGWCTDVWMTKRFSPIASSLSAVGFKVSGDHDQAPLAAVSDSAATRF